MEALKQVTHKFRIFILFVCMATWAIVSCDHPNSKKIILLDEYPSITIEKSMGDLDMPNYMALIGNIGYLVDNNLDSTEVMVLSQRIEKNIEINYNPIGRLQLDTPGGIEQIIVATTPNQLYSSIEIKDLTELSVQFGNIKRMVEQWYAGRDGLGSTRIVKWEESTKSSH